MSAADLDAVPSVTGQASALVMHLADHGKALAVANGAAPAGVVVL
jgi:hypothetical protein